MIPPDLALAQLINRTASAYTTNAPAYISYVEQTHITVPSLGRSQDINRAVEARQADDFAVMQDLPRGAVRTGQAFPIIPYFDPLGEAFSFGYFANLKNVSIDLTRYPVSFWPIPPTNPGIDVTVPYATFWVPSYAPDSTPAAPHFLITPTSAYGSGYYVADVRVDASTRLPSEITLADTASDARFVLDYQVIEGHWTVVRGAYSQSQRAGPFSFKLYADTTYTQIAFPAVAPDPRLATPPSPAPTLPPR